MILNSLQNMNEFDTIANTDNPEIPLSTKYVWILGGRHTVRLRHINCVQSSINYDPKGNNGCDVGDDYARIQAGLNITSKLPTKPYIIYNGFPEQNADLESILDNLSEYNLPDYPRDRFIIFDMPPNMAHTGGQFHSLATYNDIRLKDLTTSTVVIVTSAYHIPRVRRLINSTVFKSPFTDQTTLIFYGIDRTFQRPYAKQDIEGEIDRIKRYTQMGHIGLPGPGFW